MVTSILDLLPDSTVKKGLDRVPSRTTPPANGWFICVEDADPQSTPDSVLIKLFSRIPDIRGQLNRLYEIDKTTTVRLHISITGQSLFKSMPLYFDKSIIKNLSELGASLDIEFFE